LLTEELSDETQRKYLREYKAELDDSVKEYYEIAFNITDPENKGEVVFE